MLGGAKEVCDDGGEGLGRSDLEADDDDGELEDRLDPSDSLSAQATVKINWGVMTHFVS